MLSKINKIKKMRFYDKIYTNLCNFTFYYGMPKLQIIGYDNKYTVER